MGHKNVLLSQNLAFKELKREFFHVGQKNSSHENNEENKEEDKDTEDFDHQPSVGGDRAEVLQNFSMSGFNVESGVFHVGINPQHNLFLFLDHMGELLEDAAELNNR